MNTVTIDNATYMLPACWREMTPELLVFLAEMVLEGELVSSIKGKLALKAMNLQVTERVDLPDEHTWVYDVKNKKTKAKHRITAVQLLDIAQTYNFLISTEVVKTPTGEKESVIISPYRFTFPFPNIHVKKPTPATLTAPADLLTKFSVQRFVYAQTYRALYLKSGSMADLDQFVAVFFYPEKEAFDPEKLKPELVQALTPAQKVLCLWWYQACITFLAEKFPRTFSVSGAASNKSVFDSMQDLTQALANYDMSKLEDVRSGWLYDALYNLEGIADNNEKLKK